MDVWNEVSEFDSNNYLKKCLEKKSNTRIYIYRVTEIRCKAIYLSHFNRRQSIEYRTCVHAKYYLYSTVKIFVWPDIENYYELQA